MASGVPISGLGAPVRTAKPTPQRERSVRVAAASLFSLARFAIASEVSMATSNGSPALIFARSPVVEPKSIVSGRASARSACGWRSRITAFMPLEAKT